MNKLLRCTCRANTSAVGKCFYEFLDSLKVINLFLAAALNQLMRCTACDTHRKYNFNEVDSHFVGFTITQMYRLLPLR